MAIHPFRASKTRVYAFCERYGIPMTDHLGHKVDPHRLMGWMWRGGFLAKEDPRNKSLFIQDLPQDRVDRWIEEHSLASPRKAILDEIVAGVPVVSMAPIFTDRAVRQPDATPVEESYPPRLESIQEFYDSWDWQRLSYMIRKKRSQRCECCGATPAMGARIVCDHIRPIRKYWKLRVDAGNLQVLCDDCNRGKGSHDTTDWRKT